MNTEIKLSKHLKPNIKILSGRPNGKATRELLLIDSLDDDDNDYNVIIPQTVRTFATSFFLGLFSPSIKKLGKDEFIKKYTFSSDAGYLKDYVKNDIEVGIEWAINEKEILR